MTAFLLFFISHQLLQGTHIHLKLYLWEICLLISYNISFICVFCKETGPGRVKPSLAQILEAVRIHQRRKKTASNRSNTVSFTCCILLTSKITSNTAKSHQVFFRVCVPETSLRGKDFWDVHKSAHATTMSSFLAVCMMCMWKAFGLLEGNAYCSYFWSCMVLQSSGCLVSGYKARSGRLALSAREHAVRLAVIWMCRFYNTTSIHDWCLA